MIEAMKQALVIADKAMKDAIKYINDLKVENASLRQAIADAEKQEPVAWIRKDATLRFADGKMFAVGQPFYTHPPQRTWQGLTDEDMEELSSAWWKPNENEMALIDWVEAKLKEKNT